MTDEAEIEREKPTSKLLLAALRKKYTKAAILREVTMEDTDEQARYDQFRARNNRHYKPGSKYYIAIDYSVHVPEDYKPYEAKLVRRIDALMFEGQQRTAIEIKISRADFFRDTPEKRAAWQKHTHRFVYLTPKGLVKPEEVPEDCGLWEWDGATITSIKRAKVQKDPVEFPSSMTRYFAWRAFAAEQQVARLLEEQGRTLRKRRTRSSRR
jgi:hypothetical protein